MMLVWQWLPLGRESYWSWSLSTSSIKCHSNPVLVPHIKPPDPVMDIYDGQTYGLITSVDIWTRMDVVPVKYGIFDQMFHLMMWFFHFITGITFKWDYVLWIIIDMLVWNGLWKN